MAKDNCIYEKGILGVIIGISNNNLPLLFPQLPLDGDCKYFVFKYLRMGDTGLEPIIEVVVSRYHISQKLYPTCHPTDIALFYSILSMI